MIGLIILPIQKGLEIRIEYQKYTAIITGIKTKSPTVETAGPRIINSDKATQR